MGAVPKNKVTRVEQGKRRAGNKAQVKKDYKVTKTPMHKEGFVASLFKNLGIK